VCSLDQVQYIITDNGVPTRTVEVLQERGIKVIIAP
jgi:DeoR family transcriptional regulator, aga operon transcriptional repressor